MKDKSIELFLKNNRQLYFRKSGDQKDNNSLPDEIEVNIKQCFPWSAPGRFLSLRDEKDCEVYLIKNLNDLSELNRSAIKHHIYASKFVLEIYEIYKITDDVELRRFEVRTQQGPRVFQTKLDDWPEVKKDGRIFVRDIAGDLYLISNFNSLNSKSKKLLSTFVK